MVKRIVQSLCLGVAGLIVLPGLAWAFGPVNAQTSLNGLAAQWLAGLGGGLSALAQNQPLLYGLVAVLVALGTGLLLAGIEELVKFVWRRKPAPVTER